MYVPLWWKNEVLNFSENTQKCFAYISATKYRSVAVLYSKRTTKYPLTTHIKTITVAFLQAEIYWKQGCYILDNSKKHPILGVWYTPMEKFSRLSFALNLYSMGIFHENKVKEMILFLEKFTGYREYCWFLDIERSKCCVIQFWPIYYRSKSEQVIAFWNLSVFVLFFISLTRFIEEPALLKSRASIFGGRSRWITPHLTPT